MKYNDSVFQEILYLLNMLKELVAFCQEFVERMPYTDSASGNSGVEIYIAAIQILFSLK